MAVKRYGLSKAGSHPVSADLKWEADAVIVSGEVLLGKIARRIIWFPVTRPDFHTILNHRSFLDHCYKVANFRIHSLYI